jgi:hypothetical protein
MVTCQNHSRSIDSGYRGAMNNKPVLDAALNAAAMRDLRHNKNWAEVKASDSEAGPAATRRL